MDAVGSYPTHANLLADSGSNLGDDDNDDIVPPYVIAAGLGKNKKVPGDWTDRKDHRKGSQERQPSGQRERNVGHPDGEEHSRVPKGGPRPRKFSIEPELPTITVPEKSWTDYALGGMTILIGGAAVIILYADDVTGIGAADNSFIPVIIEWIEKGVSVFGP